MEELKPNVLVLMGPFVDAKHPSVASGCLYSHDDEENGDEGAMALTYQDLYENVLMKLSVLSDSLPKLKIVLVPSLDDVTHHAAYPQPPLPFPEEIKEALPELAKAVTCVSNPSVVRINDVVFGISNHDYHFHMGQEDVVVNSKRERMVRLSSHMLDQRSYYPIFPPPASASVDITKQDAFAMDIKPDILITPTRLNHFVKNVQGTVCINPGKITRGSRSGMYAHISIHPMSHAELTRKAKQAESASKVALLPHELASRTRVDIVRV